MARLSYKPRAIREIDGIRRYIAYRSSSSSQSSRFIQKLKKQCDKLADNPFRIGVLRPELGADIRSFPFGNYIIFFRYQGDLMQVISILEGHRDIDAQFNEPEGTLL